MPSLFTPPPGEDSSGPRAAIFAPVPRFGTATETTSHQVTDSGASGARKRSRNYGNAHHHSSSSPNFSVGVWADTPLNASRFSDVRSPPPLANERYELAGGMELPDMFSRHSEDYDDYYQLQKQRGMWSTPISPPSGLPNHLSSANSMHSSPSGAKPWVLNQILSIVGGVAGKLVQFCSVPFRGFQAGGGQAYSFNSQGEVSKANDPCIDRGEQMPQALPGNYPEDDYGVVSIESLENERPRMSKRLRTGENWVVIDKDGEMNSRPVTPRLSERRVPQHVRSPSQIPRPISRASSNNTTTPTRPSLIPVSRRSTLDRRSFHSSSRSHPKPCSTPRSYSRQSYGSPVIFQNSANNSTSPLPPESQRLINKMRREEMEDDARMRRMSSQMSIMLREAQEALGSKFEIEDVVDSGGVGGEGYAENVSWYRR
ncbi:hypothetical protein CC78DRAFT_535618 [Lojkania enalia]|uniref:Uncharacterized protein n=1 Tax=Lojkania enalia TaxID=147567 RepID=A0A9P4K582_9PLEO|nr:hypothetical protein CC78DRAFT_535618 [Didymosphaeria enalia]